MDRMGTSVPSENRHSQLIIKFGEGPLACQCSASRLQRSEWPVGLPAERVDHRAPAFPVIQYKSLPHLKPKSSTMLHVSSLWTTINY